MKLPVDALEELFSDLKHLPNEAHEIGTICPHCGRVIRHSLEPTADRPLNWETNILEVRDENVEIAAEGWLPCVEPTCKELLPIMRLKPLSKGENSWNDFLHDCNFDGLTCPVGHPILKPKDW